MKIAEKLKKDFNQINNTSKTTTFENKPVSFDINGNSKGLYLTVEIDHESFYLTKENVRNLFDFCKKHNFI